MTEWWMILVSFFTTPALSVFRILKKKIEQFYGFIRDGVGQKALDVWREDMHWILLFFGLFHSFRFVLIFFFVIFDDFVGILILHVEAPSGKLVSS